MGRHVGRPLRENDEAGRKRNNVGYIFLCGVDMNPERIRENPAYAGARFIGIGSIAAEVFPALHAVDDRVWGILLASDAITDTFETEVTDRDGKALAAKLGTRPADFADLVAVIAEARYWELPVAYWRGLASALKRTGTGPVPPAG